MQFRRSGGTALIFWGKFPGSSERIVNPVLENSVASSTAPSERSLKSYGSLGMRRRSILHTSSTVYYYES